jgi:hypothetical protein
MSACPRPASAPPPTLSAGQQLGTTLSSQPMVADVTPPQQPEGSSVYSGQGFRNEATQVGAVAAGGMRVPCAASRGCLLGVGCSWHCPA